MKNNFRPRSKLEVWVRRNGGTLKISKWLGVSQATVQNWLAGNSRPGLIACQQLIEKSDGFLTLRDLIDGTDPK